MRICGWQQRLAALIEEWRFRRFEYGSADCLQFAAAAVHAITGVDHRPQFPQYDSMFAAGRILVCHRRLEGLIGSVLGASKPVSQAQRGDIVMGDFGHGLAAAVCLGVNCAGPGPSGLEFPRTLDASRAWSV